MPTGDLVPGSDGQNVMLAGSWARDKLYYVDRYCNIFNAGMRSRWSTRAYVDLFSGPGRCAVEHGQEEFDGSPLVALKCRVPFTHFFLNDMNKAAVEALKKRAALFEPVHIAYYNEDCNRVVNRLVKDLPTNSLDFCLVDPTNWQISFESIRRLTEGRRMDLAVTFHVGAIKRCADDAPEELDDFFGDSLWRDEYVSALRAGRHEGSRVLLDAYETRLGALGYRETHDLVLVKGPRNVPLYYLMFASKHPRGKDFWDKISLRSASGQVRLL